MGGGHPPPTPVPETLLRLNLQYTHSGSVGYGRHGIELHRGLTACGVEVFDHLPQLGKAAGRHAGVAPVVCWLAVPAHVKGWVEGQYRVAYTMWEGTRLPETFRDALDDFDMVIVPSVENVELFGQHHDNVKLVYEGVNPDVWGYVPRQPGATFNFLIGGTPPDRKGIDLALDAFIKVFGNWTGDGPAPRLIVKSPRYRGTFHHDRIQVIPEKLSDEAEVALYASAHCYVQPSRGEGFGLQPLQAIAQGMPTILTDAHGHKAYSHLGIGLSASLSKAGRFVYGDAGEWWEPNFDELCDAMADVYENYDRHLRAAKLASEVVASEWTWKRSAEQFIAAVGKGRLNGWAPVDGRLVKPVQRRYKVVTVRDWSADIGDASYRFEAGRAYWETADVKRVLSDAGALDPSCLTDNDGLTPQQVTRVPGFTAAVTSCA